MTADRLSEIVEIQFEECRSMMSGKNQDYAAPEDDDALKNFRATAERTGVSVYQAWLVHFSKHVMAIEKFCKTGHLATEPIGGRITDGIDYLILLRGLIEECNPTPPVESPDTLP